MPLLRNEWTSPNGKYRILARRFDDKSFDVSQFKVNKHDKNVAVRKSSLPKYVLDQIDVMWKEVDPVAQKVK